MLQLLVVAAFAIAGLASGDVQARKAPSACDGLKGVAKGLCTAADALGCGDATKHRSVCQKLGDKFEDATGSAPPWEPVVPPPPTDEQTVTITFEVEAFALVTGQYCDDPLSYDCDFSIADGPGDDAIFVPVACDPLFSDKNYRVAVIDGADLAYEDIEFGMDYGFGDPNNGPQSFGPGQTVVLQTCDGEFFKIGKLLKGDGQATMVYQQLID